MITVNVTAIRDNSFNAKGESFNPELVSKGMVSMDDATGMKVVSTRDDQEDIEYYYIGEEVDFDTFSRLNVPDQLSKCEYAKEYGIHRFGILKEGTLVRDSKPLSPTEHMVQTKQQLFDEFNKALDLQTQKRLIYFNKRDKKNNATA